MLTGIADQMFDPDSTRLFDKEYASASGRICAGSGRQLQAPSTRLPQRAEVPRQYQLLDEEVVLLIMCSLRVANFSKLLYT